MQTNRVSMAILLGLLLWSSGCGSGGRHLQSISADATGMIQIQVTATGTFSGSPTVVTPLPVAWYVVAGNVNYQAGPVPYTLSVQPFLTSCQSATAVAIAPQNPGAPSTGTIPNSVWLDLAVNHTVTEEDGFVASPPQTIFCP